MGIIKREVSMLFRVCLLCLLLAPPVEALEVHDVVGLVQAGFDDNTIMAVIKKTGAVFPLSEEERRKLSAAGVSERLIAFMMNPSAVPLPPTQTGLPAKNKRSTAPSYGRPAGPPAHTSPPQAQSVSGPSQGKTQGQKELWQGDRQGSSSQPTG